MGDKWSLAVIAHIRDNGTRFTELRRNVDGISNRMLTSTLRNLEHDGLVARTVRPTTPPQVDYRLTPFGQALLRAIDRLAIWYEGRVAEVVAAGPGLEPEPDLPLRFGRPWKASDTPSTSYPAWATRRTPSPSPDRPRG